MKSERITNYQLFCLFIMHSVGTSTIYARGIAVKQDAWIVEIVSLIMGLGIVWVFTEVQKNFPDKNLAEINLILFGKILGGLLTIFTAAAFFTNSCVNISEFSEAVKITILPDTPILVIQVVFALVILYITFCGIEVLGRVAEMFMPVLLIFLFIILFLVYVSGQIDLKELQPVLAKGIKPVIKEAYPIWCTFPYGEDMVLLSLYCYSNNSKDVQKYSLFASLLIGILLVISDSIIICVLGADFAGSSTLPLLEVIKTINVSDIITNMDAFGLVIIFIGGLFKVMLYLYSAALFLSTLFNIKREIVMLILMATNVWFNLYAIPNPIVRQFYGINFFALYLLEIYTIYIPLLTLIIIWLKKFLNNQNIKANSK